MVKNELGNKYGRLLVIEQVASINEKAAWLSRCDCGNTKIVTGDSLRTGKVSSCGCYQKEMYGLSSKTHGMSKTQTYRSWQEMKTRCFDKTSVSYKNYGGRGITVCKRWDKFENFIFDMGVRPKGATLDRIKTNKGYSPSNCKWSTRTEQNRNKRSNILISYKGEKLCLSEWCEKLNLKYPRTYNRIVVNKWPVAKAFETSSLKPYLDAVDM